MGSAEPLPEGAERPTTAETASWTAWHAGQGRPVGFLGRSRRNLPRGGFWRSHQSVAVTEREGKAQTSLGLAVHCRVPGTHSQVPLWLTSVAQKQGLPGVRGGPRPSRASAYGQPFRHLQPTSPCSCSPFARGFLYLSQLGLLPPDKNCLWKHQAQPWRGRPGHARQ